METFRKVNRVFLHPETDDIARQTSTVSWSVKYHRPDEDSMYLSDPSAMFSITTPYNFEEQAGVQCYGPDTKWVQTLRAELDKFEQALEEANELHAEDKAKGIPTFEEWMDREVDELVHA